MAELEHPLLSTPGGPLLLALLLLAGLGLFFYQLFTAYRLVRLGKPDDRFRDWGRRVRRFLTDVLFQRKVRQDPVAGNLHALIFWGFLLLASDMADLATGGWFEGWLAGLGQGVADFWNLTVDLGYLLAWVGVTGALLRRTLFRPAKLEPSFEGNLILVLAFIVVVTAFLLEGALEAGTAADKEAWTEPVGSIFAGALAGLSAGNLEIVAGISYWLHMVSLAFFLFLIPRSKHMHIVGATLSTVFADDKPLGKLVTIDVEAQMERMEADEEPELGAVKVTDYSWKGLLDGFACTHCARCQEVCPAHASGKVLNPMHLIHDLRDNLLTHQAEVVKGPSLLLASGHTTGDAKAEKLVEVYTPEALWACTTCYACVSACPVHIEHVPKITDVRRSLVMLEADFPNELATVFQSLERQSNPWGAPPHQRMVWAEGLEVPKAADKQDFEVLFYVGCAGATDERNRSVSRAVVKLLKAARVDFAVLGEEEPCCGDPARRAGNEFLYWQLATANIEAFKQYSFKTVISACPHCTHTLGVEYPDYDWDCEVVHHSVYLKRLLDDGRLKVEPTTLEKLTYHDPCYLGRIGGHTAEPRAVLEAAGGKLTEMARHGEKSFCCGGGGSRFWMEEEADQRVNSIRAEEALATGAETVAVGCPFCMTMLTDGFKELAQDRVKVLDLAEVLATNIQ